MERLLSLYGKNIAKGAHAQSIPFAAHAAVKAAPPLLEVKHRIGKSSQRFMLEDWHHSPSMVVGRWISVSDGKNNYSPAGAYSWGVWWKDSNIGAYRIHDPFGNPLAYRIDVLKDVVISETNNLKQLDFSDLIVDLWLWSEDGQHIIDVTIEDLDELEACKTARVVSAEDCGVVNSTVDAILSDPSKVVQLVNFAIDSAVESRSVT